MSPTMNRLFRWLLLLVATLIALHLLHSTLLPSHAPVPISAFPRPDLRNSNGSRFQQTFPALIHVMWKNGGAPPPETVHWQTGCKQVNSDMRVAEYNDDDLAEFTKLHYPEYLPLFSKLKGVHMADMARVLIAYHFGGLYMDLDFYCVRPFHCLHQFLPASVSPNDHILIVPEETRMHSTILRGKTRVIIQDFFYATPRHPFFKYLLDDRMEKFNKDTVHFAKGPFGYHIEEDIDDFWKSEMSRSVEGGRRSVIFELRDDTLHSLGDATHPRLNQVCYAAKVPDVSASSCANVQRGEYFQPSRNTIAVHMWFHTYLGWHIIRGLRNKATYAAVERSLPQTPQC